MVQTPSIFMAILPVNEWIEGAGLEAGLECLHGFVAAGVVVDLLHVVRASTTAGSLSMTVLPSSLMKRRIVHPAEHVQPAIAEVGGEADGVMRPRASYSVRRRAIVAQFVPIARRPGLALLIDDAGPPEQVLVVEQSAVIDGDGDAIDLAGVGGFIPAGLVVAIGDRRFGPAGREVFLDVAHPAA